MAFLRTALTVAFLITGCLIPITAAQSGASDDVFTLVVTPPTLAKDVQLRYYVATGSGSGGYGVASVVGAHNRAIAVDGNKIRFKTPGISGQQAKTMKLLAYTPGCQFVILTIADLSNSTREADFECQHLPTLLLRGRVDIHDFGQQDLEVEAQYSCRMAMLPYHFPLDDYVLPLSLSKAPVASDGTFTMDVPDFVTDPSWPQLSGNASLQFTLLDAKTGKRLAFLVSPADLFYNQGRVPVASSYPEIALSVYHPEARVSHQQGTH